MRRWATVLLVATIGCDNSRVRWQEVHGAPEDTTGTMTLGTKGELLFSLPGHFVAPSDPGMCPLSVASAVAKGRQYSTWLRMRPDSSALVVAAQWDGRQWSRPAIVDSLDTGRFGCARPKPSIAVSEADGYVHVAYSLKAPEGYGVFFSHSMDDGRSFHAPMIVVYGDRLSSTAIAAHGTRVAIAYESPSGTAQRIDVALSSTQGHTFEPRESGTPDEMSAVHPRIAVRDTIVALSFAGSDSTQRAIRIGYLRK
jgi:hypothetical protein